MLGYSEIKDLARMYKARVDDFFALSSGRDPYYLVGNPNERAEAEWFADLYQQYWHTLADPMVRSLHYAILHHEVYLPGKQRARYINLDSHYQRLLDGSRIARYLGLVPMDIVEETKNEPDVFIPPVMPQPTLDLDRESLLNYVGLFSFPDLPHYSLTNFPFNQRYHLEIWCEKSYSSLKRLAQKYGAVFQQGMGEQTLVCAHMLTERRKKYKRPIRIFYVSDFDPAGTTMPVSVSRKLEYMLDDIRGNEEQPDIRLYNLILTQEQVHQYHLPRTPIKSTEARKDVWEAVHGVDAVELNALEAQPGYKGELVRIVEEAMLQYYDTELQAQAKLQQSQFAEYLTGIQQDVYRRFPKLRRLRQEYDDLVAEIEPTVQEINDELKEIWEEVSDEMEQEMPDFDEYLQYNPLPEPKVAQELESPLYDSKRDYFNQLAIYKKHQGKRVVF